MPGMIAADLRSDLIARGCCVEIHGDTDHLLAAQARTLRYLQTSIASATSTDRYLKTYDSLMRVVESWLIRNSLRFGQSPHKGLSLILSAHLSESRELIDRLVSQRHRSKKDGEAPPQQSQRELEMLYESTISTFGSPV